MTEADAYALAPAFQRQINFVNVLHLKGCMLTTEALIEIWNEAHGKQEDFRVKNNLQPTGDGLAQAWA